MPTYLGREEGLIQYEELSRSRPRRPAELQEVRVIAGELLSAMNDYSSRSKIAAAHVLHASSANIQTILQPAAMKLGFTSEKKGLFADYKASGMRPDYFRAVGASGIMLEVERGKTLANNMDLLDLWKCHICSSADYLFLVVPQRRPRGSGKSENIYGRVVRRLETFFQPKNRVNVEAVFVFGY